MDVSIEYANIFLLQIVKINWFYEKLQYGEYAATRKSVGKWLEVFYMVINKSWKILI